MRIAEYIHPALDYLQTGISEGEALESQVFDSDWLLYITTIPLVIYLLASLIEKRPIAWLSKVVYSNSFSSAAFRNRSPGTSPGSTLLLVCSFMGLATISYFAEELFSFRLFGLTGPLLWTINLVIISLSVGIRYVLLSFLGEFTGSRAAFEEYGFNIAQLYKFAAIPLLIINFSIPYLELISDRVLIIISILFIGNLLIIRLIRLMSIFIKRGFSLLYMILYLCALEFTPWLIVIKYLKGAV